MFYEIRYFLLKKRRNNFHRDFITAKNQHLHDNIGRELMRNPNLTRIPSFDQRFRKRPPTNIQSLRFETVLRIPKLFRIDTAFRMYVYMDGWIHRWTDRQSQISPMYRDMIFAYTVVSSIRVARRSKWHLDIRTRTRSLLGISKVFRISTNNRGTYTLECVLDIVEFRVSNSESNRQPSMMMMMMI